MNKAYENYIKNRRHEFVSPVEKMARQKDTMQSYIIHHDDRSNIYLQEKEKQAMIDSIADEIVKKVNSLLK